uniref:Uncharacterized protein n=1 Tax=Trichuris muris TaxID=70415 RepID=A0A5S6QZK4_TRIMR
MAPLIAINVILLLNDSYRWFDKITYGWRECCMLFIITALAILIVLSLRVYGEAKRMDVVDEVVEELQDEILEAKEKLTALGVNFSPMDDQ